MGETTHDGLTIPGRAVLAHERPFRLGSLRIEPPTRQVAWGNHQQSLEPRVMQVLVVLAGRGGNVVTRDELIHSCWDGRIVGDDAIHRVISRLRHLAEESGGSFRIETIPRVGYRLLADSEDTAASLPTEDGVEKRPSRRNIVLGMGAVAVAAGIGATASSFLFEHKPGPLARTFYQRGLAARGQASRAMSEQGVADLREAVRLDPEFAEAWGALAWAYRGLLEFGPHPDSERIHAAAQSAARRALELQPENFEAQAAILLLPPFYRNWGRIEEGCRDLAAREPTNSIAQYNLAFVLMETGRWLEAIPHLQIVKKNEPLWPLPRMRLSQALRTVGRIEETDDEIDGLLKSWPRRFDIWSLKSRHLLMTGRAEEALLFVEDAALQPPDSRPFLEIDQAFVRAFTSKSEADRQRAVQLRLSDPRLRSVAIVWAVLDFSFLGEVDLAYALLDGYYFGRGEWASVRSERPRTEFLFHVMAERLRNGPRFQTLLEETGLERFWRQTIIQPDFRRT